MATDLSARVSAAEAARLCGLSEKTVRRWITAGKLRADRANGSYSVDLGEVSALAGQVPAHGADMGTDTGADVSAQDVRTAEAMGTDIMRAEAMAAYTRSLLEPLVAHVAELEGTIRDQAETIATLREERGCMSTELEAVRKSLLDARIAAIAVEPPPGPSTWRSWVSGHVGAAVVGFIAVVALVLGLVDVLH